VVLSLDEREKKQYEKWFVACRDIRLARQCAEVLLKKGWHYHPWEKRGSIYFQQSVYVTAVVVSYARAFTLSKGWPRLRLSWLDYNTLSED
jgi:hypothetical protein